MLPYLQEVQNASKKYNVVFKGINYGEGTQDGEFAETYNLSTDKYPCITQRAARVMAGKYTLPSTLHAKNELLVIDGGDVLYGGTKVGDVKLGKKQTATIGNFIVIFPDKKYYKVPTEDDKDGEFGDMEIKFTNKSLGFSSNTISLKNDYSEDRLVFSTSSITRLTEYTGRLDGYEELTNGLQKFYLDAATFPFRTGETVIITIGSETSGEIVLNTVHPTFIAVVGSPLVPSISMVGKEMTIQRVSKEKFPFVAGEVMTITGCTAGGNNKTDLVIKEATDNEITFEEGTFVEATEMGTIKIQCDTKFPFKAGDAVTITGCSENGNNMEKDIIVKGATDDVLTFDDNTFTEATEDGEVTISRTVPDLDFICESNYRLWGTHGNTIYSSKYSDPLNFQAFENLSNDSYAIEVGSEGEFTGCIPYASHICFFKENTLHKLYGTKPSNFQITTVNVYGVQSGSERSMQIVNEQLLYKGVGGVYAYTGGVPELISEKFGNNRYAEAVACCDGEKYYISMKQGDTWNMFAYDVAKNIWLREDDTQAVDMTFYDGKVYYLDAKGGLYYIDKTADRSDIEWGATFCTMHETINERKGYSKFHLRMDMSEGSWLAVDIKTDNDLQWKQVYTTHNEKAKTVSIPIMPTRCDSIDIRLRGKGKCTIKTFIREFTVGSDV